MSSLPLITGAGARGWVNRVSSIFRKEIAIHIDHLPPVCVFQVPKALSAQKPEAYTPQLIAMGPYHHLRAELYQMERYKLAAIKEITTPDQILSFQNVVINKLKEFDPSTRACYNKFMDYDEDTLAWIMAIDGCFLLNLARSYLESHDPMDKKLLDNALVTRDIMMVENQIPYVILKEIRKGLHLCSDDDNTDENDPELFCMLADLCEALSPVSVSIVDKSQFQYLKPLHLLDLMYHLIVNIPAAGGSHAILELPVYRDSHTFSSSSTSSSSSSEDGHDIQDGFGAILDLVDNIGNKRAQAILKPIKVASAIPWSTISGLFRKATLHDGLEENSSNNNEIAIPSVTYLWRYAQVKCRPIITGGGINNIKFVNQGPEVALYLPVLNLNASSEVIFRNLVAYEAAMSTSTLELARFVNLMNGIIDVPEDVKLLRQNGVILGTLNDEEIADLFNGMKRFYVKSNQRSNIEIAIEEVNKYYDQKLMVRFVRRVKKNLYASWKCVALISTILLFLVLAAQSFCEVYTCSRFLKAN